MHYLPPLVSAIAMFILGGLWYSPMLFAKPWTQAMGIDTSDKAKVDEMRKKAGPAYLQTFLLAIFTSLIFQRLFISESVHSVRRGVEITVVLCLATVVMSRYTQKLFAQSSAKLFFIDAGYYLASFAVMGAILAARRA